MIIEGAAYIDVGAEATNPRAAPLENAEAEWERLRPVLGELFMRYPGKISVDSYRPETIRRVAERFGPNFIANDVTGMNSPIMRKTVAEFGLRCIVSHMPARFGADFVRAHHEADVDDPQAVALGLLTRRSQLVQLGLPAGKIILDPGIGFGKRPDCNRRLLSFARLVPEHEVMIGYSRKRFLGDARMTIGPNLEAARVAIASGARYLRVHDVAEHYQLLQELGVQ